MPLTIAFRGPEAPQHPSIDIVTICNLFGVVTPPLESWKWITDLCRQEAWTCRVLLYDCQVDATIASGLSTNEVLRLQAGSLLDELLLDRNTQSRLKKPLIFVCHGFGGLVLKSALVLSSEERPPTAHWRSVYLSTYAVLFGSTPHHGITREACHILSPGSSSLSPFAIGLINESLSKNDIPLSTPLTELHSQFEPLTDLIRIFNCWERQQTCSASDSAYIVDRRSAAPSGARAETYGINAVHKRLLSVDDHETRDFEYIANILRSCAWHAPSVIDHRWQSHSAIDHHQDSPLSSRACGHAFQANNVTGGRAHFGDSYTYNYATKESEAPELTHGSDQKALLAERSLASKRSNLTRRSSNRFTGRQLQLGILKQELGDPNALSAHDKPRVVVIHGWGGAGKTELCLRFAEQALAHQTYWGVFWIDASSRANAEHAYSAMGQDQGRSATFEAGKFWLEECLHPWLLVLDNADGPSESLKVSELVPRIGRGHVLVTTRNRNVFEAFPGAFTLELRGMDPEDAVDFLLKWANLPANTHERATAQEVAVELGYLALALRLAGSAIRKTSRTLKQYLEFYLRPRKQQLRSSRSVQPEPEETNAIATWEVSFKKMEDDPAIIFADAQLLLSILANLHFESIARAWLVGQNSEVVLPNVSQAVPETWNDKDSRISRALNALYDYSIVDYNANTEIYSMHPVIHNWVRLQLAQKEEEQRWLDCTMQLLSGTISPYLEASTRGRRRSLLPHVRFCITNLKNSERGTKWPCEDHTARQLERFASVYAETGNWTEARELQQRVVTYFKRTLGTAHRNVLTAERVQAQMAWNRFEVGEAISIQTQLLLKRMWSRPRWTDWFPLWRPAYLDYCVALDDLTQSLWLAGELGISSHTGNRALRWFEENLSAIDPLTLNAKLNMGRTFHHLGKLEEARRLLAEVVIGRRRLFGEDHPDTLMARNELGMVFLARQQFGIAEQIVANVYNRRRMVLGEEHAYTLWSANDLAKVHFSRVVEGVDGYPYAARAVDLLDSIIPIVARTLGQNHVGMLMTKGNLARAYVRCQRLDDAMALLEGTLLDIKVTHPNWAEIMTGKAEVQLRLGRLGYAEATCREVLQRLATAEQPQAHWILRFVGPKEPVRASDLQSIRISKLLEEIADARTTR